MTEQATELTQLETILDWIRWGSSQFSRAGLYYGHGTENAWDEAAVLLLWAIDQPWEYLDKILAARLSEAEKQRVYQLYKRRVDERIPAAYLTGVAWFAGYPYKVTEDVLVPRSPIAELILSDFAPWLEQAPMAILDLCTGSGCIGIACAHQFAEAEVTVSDISDKAIAVADKNIEFHGLEERVSAKISDGFESLGDSCYDLIVSNPPYVDKQDLAGMPAEYHAEPSIGLASGDDGLDLTRKILHGAADRLNPGGLLVVEVGNSWTALEQAFPSVPFFWPELENGGHGVFVLTREQLVASIGD